MSGKKIKIALCLSGDPRNSLDTFPFIYNIFLNNPEYDTDVYIHSYKSSASINLYKPKKCLLELDNESKVINNVFSQIPNIEKIKLIGNCNNTVLMYYSMYKCFNLIEDLYDVYIRLRFDSYFYLNEDFTEIIHNILHKNYDVFIPKDKNENFYWKSNYDIQGYSDRFAIGNLKSMKLYFNTYLNIKNIVTQTQILNTHHLLFNQMNSENIKIFQKLYYDKLLRNSTKQIFNSFSTIEENNILN